MLIGRNDNTSSRSTDHDTQDSDTPCRHRHRVRGRLVRHLSRRQRAALRRRRGCGPGCDPRTHNANSLDFTYHSCVDFPQPPGQPPQFLESGYFWVSSYQSPASVVDSQINYFVANGYRIYAKYRYQAEFVNAHQPSPSGLRLNYVAPQQPALIELYLDQSNTVLDLQNCAPVVVAPHNDDILLGSSMTLNYGEKSETNNVAATGDFELRFGNWTFTNFGQASVQFPQPGRSTGWW